MNPTGRKTPLIGLIFQVQKETIAYLAPPTPNNAFAACCWCQEDWFTSYNGELYYIATLENPGFLNLHGGAKFKYHHILNNSTIEGLAVKVIS